MASARGSRRDGRGGAAALVAGAVLLAVAGGCGGMPPEGRRTSPPLPADGARPTLPRVASPSPRVASPSPPVATPAPVTCPDADGAPLPASEDPVARPAVPAVLALFDEAPIVAIGEYHGWQAQHDFLARLICDPAFPAVVDTIVVEFGNSRLQSILDRYVVAGESVGRAELQSVWKESTQRSGVWDHPVYERFFGLVRTVNATLPAADRIRVLGGDPPIDYDGVHRFDDCSSEDPACLDYWLQRRDESFADIVAGEARSTGHTALLVAGVGHMLRRQDDERPPSIPDRLEEAEAGSTRVVIPHRGFGAVDPASEQRIRSWPVPAVALLTDSWPGDLDACLLEAGDARPTDPPCPDGAGPTLADVADAYLYVGPG